mgnify:FL=1
MGIAEHQARAIELLGAAGILPVVTVHTLDQARAVSAALLEGGLPAIELTLRTPVAMDALALLKRELPDVVVGAGTVLTVDQMQQAIDAGADFLVTPGTPAHMADALAGAPLPVVPGAATPTELLALHARGFQVCKLFPATAVGGLPLIKGIAGPMPDLKLCPTGGITESNAADFLEQPNVICIGGSWMVPASWIGNGEWDKVREASARAAQVVARVRRH